MNKYELLREKLKNRETVTMANLMLSSSPLLLNCYASADCVLLDKEHGIYGTEELIPMTMRCRELGLPAIVRVEDSAYHLIAKAIDLGADGIMLPRTETVEQVRTAVEAMHFAPIGRTGFGGWGIMREGESFADFQRGRILMPQIESPKGLKNLPAMVEAYGEYIDAFIIGPNDYSIMVGLPREVDSPRMIEEIRKVFECCRALGKSCGCYGGDDEHTRLYRSMGANVFWMGSDDAYLRRGWEAYRAVLDE